MWRRLIFVSFVVFVVGLVNVGWATELAVDFAMPSPLNGPPHAATAKGGYIIWNYPPGDLWQHDPKTFSDIGGSGIDVTIRCGYEGNTSMKVLGMQPEDDDTAPTGTPSGDAIANSWIISNRHWGNNKTDIEGRMYWGSIFLRLYGDGLANGRYRLKSYHNCPLQPGIVNPNNDNDWDVEEGNDVMPSITVSGEGVNPIVELTNVQIQHEESDSALVPVEIEFEICGTYTSGSPVTVHFESPPGGDEQQGGAAVLNAFVLYVPAKGQASCPDPGNGSEHLCPDVELNWDAGAYVEHHDVYLGTSFEDVHEASTVDHRGVYMGPQPAADTNYVPEPPLDLGQVYYWRIDEVNSVNVPPVYKGEVWMFTTNDGNAFDPSPVDGASAVPLDANLVWWPGCLATSHDVYFGTSYADVRDADSTWPEGTSVYKGNQTIDANKYEPGGLGRGITYYWRIDELGSTYKGPVWSFESMVDPNLMVWYKLDETIGNEVADYSGHKLDGWVRDAQPWTWEPTNGHYDGCIYFRDEEDESLIVPPESLASIDKEITVSVWVNGERSIGDMPIFDTGDEGADGQYKLTACVPSSTGDVSWRAGDDSNDVLVWLDASPAGWRGNWHHFAFIKAENSDTMSIYFDGSLADSRDGVSIGSLINAKSEDSRGFKIGAYNDHDSDYVGRLDDFRLYNYALSSEAVSALFRGGDVALAWGPKPYNGETDVVRHVVLKWKPGNYAASHNVYFGSDWDDVNDADTSSSVFIDNREPNEYDPPGNLGLGSRWYWRIDEVNNADGNSPWKGNIWEFTVADFIIVDDMESYCTGYGCTNEIFDTWIDGFIGPTWTGAEVSLGTYPIEPVHGGSQSMVYVYDGADSYGYQNDYFSEIERTYADPCDWTEAGVEILTLFFYGDADNDADGDYERPYVGLEDSTGSGSYAQVGYGDYGEDMNDIKKEEWQQWDIALQDFSGVDRSIVQKVYIGFGMRGNPWLDGTPGGNGTVYFDNIRLYVPKCVPWRLKPAADLTDDCVVNLADVGEMAEQWLRTDACLPVQEPLVDPVGWWKLDEGAGSVANDSTVPANNGTISGLYSWVVGYDNVNSAVEFSNGKVLVPDAAELRPAAAVSVCAWVNFSSNRNYSARVVVKGADNKETFALQVDDDDELNFFVRDANNNIYDVNSEEIWRNEWVHLAGTFDGDINTIAGYVNGQLAGSQDDANFVMQGLTLSQDTNDLGIGNRSDANDRQFEGSIDDVRVYNYGLSAAEVAWIATDGTGYIALTSEANLYDEEPKGEKAINFKDIAVLMDSWREEKLWPE